MFVRFPVGGVLLGLTVSTAAALACASASRVHQRADYEISPESLHARLFDFAADSMLGRSYLNGGHERATRYLAGEAAKIGLQPAGDSGGWFQTFHMYSRRMSPASQIIAGDLTLMPVRDFKLLSFGLGQPRSFEGARVVYGGIVGDTVTQISAAVADGRAVMLGVPADMTPERVYRDAIYGPASRFGRAAVVIIASLDYMTPSQRGITTAVGLRELTTPRADLQPATVLVTRGVASGLLERPLESAQRGVLGRTLRDRVVIDERDNPTRNVIGMLRGTDNQLANTYVALGAHSDHLGFSTLALDHDSVRAGALGERRYGEKATVAQIAALRDSLMRAYPTRRDSIYNGADDDGSGTVALLEIARALASGRPPPRSVLFVWHAAEEDGLIGSGWFTSHPTVPLDSIVAQINLDMVGRGGGSDTKKGGARFLQVIGSTRRSPELWPLLAEVNRKRTEPFSIDSADSDGVYCRSEHWSYARFGVPIAFLTTGPHADYHAVTDEPQYIDYEKLAAVSRFTLDVTSAIANRTARLVIVGPKLDPKAFCRG